MNVASAARARTALSLLPHARTTRLLFAATLLLTASCGGFDPLSRNKLDAEGYTPLMRAAEHDDVDRIRSLIAWGADPNYQGRRVVRYSLLWPFRDEHWEDVPVDSLTPLMVAARSGRRASAQALLAAGANPNAATHVGRAGRTALSFTAESGDATIGRALLAGGADPQSTASGEALVHAVKGDKIELASVLIEAGVGDDVVGARGDPSGPGVGGDVVSARPGGDPDGRRVGREIVGAGGRALTEAARRGHADIVAALAGSRVRADSRAAADALLAAAEHGQRGAVEILLSRGTPPDAAGIPVGWTALGLAAANGHAAIARDLLAAGAKVDAAQTSLGSSPRGAASASLGPRGAGRGTALVLAATAGHEEVVRALLAAGAATDATDTHGYTAAALAERGGHTGVVTLLQGPGSAAPATRSRAPGVGTFALIDAVRKGDRQRVEGLVADGIDVNVRVEGSGRPLLAEATLAQQPAIVDALLAGGADPNGRGSTGDTALLMAVIRDDAALVRRLMQAGADVDVQGLGGETALGYAARTNRVALVRAMLPDADAENRAASLVAAAAGGSVESARALLATKPDVRGKSAALVTAAREGHAEIAAELLRAGAAANERDARGVTALMWAAHGGHVEIIRALIAAGADVNARFTGNPIGNARLLNSTDWTALMWAAANDRSGAVAALVDAGARVDGVDSRKQSAIDRAAHWGDLESVRALRAVGAVTAVSDAELGQRALHRAAQKGDAARVRALVSEGVPPDARDPYGVTALILAAKSGKPAVVRELLAAGADVNAKGRDGANALYWAQQWKHREVVDALRAAGARDEPPTWKR